MISVEIEKEINQENKIAGDFNFRQVVCIVIIAIFSIFSVLVLKVNQTVQFCLISAVGAVCWAFGWYKPNGVPFERILKKKIQESFYHSAKRKYKTKNQYVELVNTEYNRRRNIDLSNKKLAKQINKEAKMEAKKIAKASKHSTCKPIL